jgi:hypothetical protein
MRAALTNVVQRPVIDDGPVVGAGLVHRPYVAAVHAAGFGHAESEPAPHLVHLYAELRQDRIQPLAATASSHALMPH